MNSLLFYTVLPFFFFLFPRATFSSALWWSHHGTKNFHYIIVQSHLFSTTVTVSPLQLASPRSNHELDFASLTFWTRLRVVHGFRLSVNLVWTSSSLIQIYWLTLISTTTNSAFLVSHSFLQLFPLPPWLVPLGAELIPGGRYMHPAWLRTASDTVSSLGTDPWTPAVSLYP